MQKLLQTFRVSFVACALFASVALSGAHADEEAANGPFEWTGFYIGGHAGGISGSTRGSSPPSTPSSIRDDTDPAGVAGGLLAGYNHQIRDIVFGIEADVTFSDAGDGYNTTNLPQTIKVERMYSVRGRLGYAIDRSLFYITGGFTWAETDFQSPAASKSDSATFRGAQVGGGLEHMLTPFLSVRGEYLYGLFDAKTVTSLPGQPIRHEPETHTFRAAVAWHFNAMREQQQAFGFGATDNGSHDWTGIYLGAHAGFLSGNTRGSLIPGTNIRYDGEPSGVAGGVLGGYNHQFGNVLIGVEADATYSDSGDGITRAGIGTTVAVDEIYSVRGRLGYSANGTLLYVTGGYAIARAQFDSPVIRLSERATFDGFQVGGGLEHMLNPSVSLRGEYLYADFGRENVLYLVGSGAPVSLEMHAFRAALSWHFNSLNTQNQTYGFNGTEGVTQNWTGFYVGGHAGAVSGTTRGSFPPNSAVSIRYDTEPSGIAGGVLGGYNHQIGNVVLGVEADVTISDAGDGVNNGVAPATMDIEEMYSVRGRLGYAMGNTLLYATGGPAWVETTYETPPFTVRDKVSFDGFQVGGGFEHRLSGSVGIRGEYLYGDFGRENVTYIGTSRAPQSLETHSVRAAVVWNFGVPLVE